MPNIKLPDTEHVARAIFLPAMLDSSGKVSLAAFTLRHNEGYFSVSRMAVDGWLEDIKRIPTSPTRQLGGYCKMGVCNIRGLGFVYDEENEVAFDVENKATDSNKSHAGIIVVLSENTIKGDKTVLLKPLPTGVSATGLLMRIQTKLAQFAAKNYVTIGSVFGDGNEGIASGNGTLKIEN